MGNFKILFCTFAVLAYYYVAADIECQVQDEESVGQFFPHEANCSLFYACDNGEPVVMECAPGLYWNQDELTCDYAVNVECDAE